MLFFLFLHTEESGYEQVLYFMIIPIVFIFAVFTGVAFILVNKKRYMFQHIKSLYGLIIYRLKPLLVCVYSRVKTTE